MNRVHGLIATLMVWVPLLWSGVSCAQTQAHIFDLSPAEGAEIHTDVPVYVGIEFQTDVPVRLWARPYFKGKAAPAASNASGEFSGSGQALGWFSLSKPGEVDEIRIEAGGGSPYREWVIASEPVQYTWSTEGRRDLASPQWANKLRREAEIRQAQRAQQNANSPSSGGGGLAYAIVLIAAALIIGGFALPIVCVRRWKGGWRLAAAAPLAAMGFVILRLLFDLSRDPTSHNLWPFELLMYGAASVGFITLLSMKRKFDVWLERGR